MTALADFARRFLKEAGPIVEFVHAAYEDGILDRNPGLTGNAEDVLNELIGEAEQVVQKAGCD